MGAKGKNKSPKSKGKKFEKMIVPKQQEEEDEEDNFDLETMEKMLANEDNLEDQDEDLEESDEDNDNGVEDFMDNDHDDDMEEEGDDSEEEENYDELEDEVEELGDSDDEEDQYENEDNEEEIEMSQRNESLYNKVEGDENCTLDLRNLLSINPHQVNHRLLYKQKGKEGNDNAEDVVTICTDGMMKANEDYLLQKASEGCSQLLAGLWVLEKEKSEAGPMAVLPTYCHIVTPRELPPPQQKAETKWEKFAKERGIKPKEKRSRKVWDEATQSWAYRTGYQKASSVNDPESWPIMEVKKNDDPFEDPWQRARDAKKERIEKNTLNRMANAEREGQLERGTTRRIMKAKKEAREKGREGGSMDMKNFKNSPAGVPLDLVDGKQRGKALTKMALLATQRSTASMGKFDKMREGEPERRKTLSGMKKRKFESATSTDIVKTEAKKSMKVLENIISGGGKSKERAIRKGHYAKGETGHDYDFDDGLGSSSFKKKKGRAGIGKMRKITKKIAK